MGAIYLVRHGQASFGSDNYDALSSLGHRQAGVVGRALKVRGVVPDMVFSGSMRRHQETAVGAVAELGVNRSLQVLPGVNEFDHENVIQVAEPRYASKIAMMADMAGADDPRRAFQKFFQDAVSRWLSGHHDDEYAEPWSVFKLRCVTALDELVRATPAKGQAVVFTSGGTISVMCAHLLGLSDAQAFTINWTLVNTGITKVVTGRDGVRLVSVNEHAHLEGGEAGMLTYR
jgi:broad specificity phosphatase PhoE